MRSALHRSKQPTCLVVVIHMTSEDGTHSRFRNVVSKLASHIVQ